MGKPYCDQRSCPVRSSCCSISMYSNKRFTRMRLVNLGIVWLAGTHCHQPLRTPSRHSRTGSGFSGLQGNLSGKRHCGSSTLFCTVTKKRMASSKGRPGRWRDTSDSDDLFGWEVEKKTTGDSGADSPVDVVIPLLRLRSVGLQLAGVRIYLLGPMADDQLAEVEDEVVAMYPNTQSDNPVAVSVEPSGLETERG